jgi:hypothetical protein
MKAIAVLILASLPVHQVQVAPQAQPHFTQQLPAPAQKSGKWYLARTGHAVYCYGPVMTVPNAGGELERVATFCRGDRLLVPLKD